MPKITASSMNCSRRKAAKGLPQPGSGIMAIKRRWNPMDRQSETPGVLRATGGIDPLRGQEEASQAEGARIQHASGEIERRDGAAQWQAALWFRFACLLAVVLIVALSVIAYLALKASQVQAFVQPVQITEEGKMVLIGVPKDLFDYQPEDSQWMDMLAQWEIGRASC